MNDLQQFVAKEKDRMDLLPEDQFNSIFRSEIINRKEKEVIDQPINLDVSESGSVMINKKKTLNLRELKEKSIHTFFLLNGLLVIVVLLGIFALLVFTSLPAFKEINLLHFFFSANWNPTSFVKESYGILSMIVSTLMVTIGALVISVPLGIGTAAYLSDVAGKRVREIGKPVVEILAGIPYVVIGFLGIVLVGPMIAKVFHLPNGLNALNGSILLAFMALPTITSLSEDALKNVPRSYEEASLALGATRWQTVLKVKIPAAKSGILASCMLGMGRAIGETMAILMVPRPCLKVFWIPFEP